MSLAAADFQHGTSANRLVLRDGSVATVRPATPAKRGTRSDGSITTSRRIRGVVGS